MAKRLTTERLILRPPVRDDLPAIAALLAEPGVAEATLSLPASFGTSEGEAWLIACTRKDLRPHAILRNSDQMVLGTVTLALGGQGRAAQLEFWIGRPFWGQGYATEAVRRLLRFAFGERKLRSAEAAVFPDNVAAIRVLAKTGFSEYARGRRLVPPRSGERDVAQFVATRASYAQAVLSQAVGRA